MVEVEKLHSRLEQQSGLICMLKQRNDKALLEVSSGGVVCSPHPSPSFSILHPLHMSTCASKDTSPVHGSSCVQLSEVMSKYELSCQRVESLQQSLAQEMGQHKLLLKRFQALAENHDQMIRLKDEYKEEAQGLRQSAGQEQEGQKRAMELEEELVRVRRECQERLMIVEERLTKTQAERDAETRRSDDVQRKLNETLREHSNSIQHLQTNLKGMFPCENCFI